jgi:hypothetical protein
MEGGEGLTSVSQRFAVGHYARRNAILFWNRFQGRWLRGDEFHYPEVPQGLPPRKDIPHEKYSKRRPER